MALQDILQKLRSDTEAEIARITSACEHDIAEVKQKNDLYLVGRKNAATVDAERRANKVAERILSKARHQATFIETAAVQAELELVFKTVHTKLVALAPEAYEVYLAKQFATLPKLSHATYHVAAERADATTDFLHKNGVDKKDIETATGLLGGFVVATSDREYDYSFAGLLQKIRNEQAVAISKQLST